MKKSIILAFSALLLGSAVKAQTYDITGIKRVNPTDLSAIVENNEIKGYYAFYYLDKESKKQALYNLSILDNNLKLAYSVEMKKSDKLYLLESGYNGERFCFSFLDRRERVLSYDMLDKTGKAVGTYSIQLSKREANQHIAAIQQQESMAEAMGTPVAGGLIAVKNKGFLRIGQDKTEGQKVELEMIDNNGKLKWLGYSGFEVEGKSYETANFLYADDKAILLMLTTRGRKLSTKGLETWLVGYDSETGKQLFKVEQVSSQYQLSSGGVSYDQTSGSYFVYGQYWAKEDNIIKDDSKGMYLQELGPDGKVKKESYSTWAGEVNNMFISKAKKKYEDNTHVFMHQVVRTADGKTFAIGELYRKAVSGWGVASKFISGQNSNTSVMKIITYDMVVFEFDNALKINDVHVIEKEKTNVQLPAGVGMMDANLIAYFLKIYKEFDYAYTTVSADRKQFNSAYVNYDKEKGAGSNYVVGNISYTKDLKVVGDKIRLKNDPTRFWVLPSKPGYVVIFEYYRKKKTAIFRMEKLNL